MTTAVERVSFFVAGLPKAQPRVKAYTRGSQAGVYTPSTADAWKAQVVAGARDLEFFAHQGMGVELALAFAFMRPKLHFGTGRNEGVLKDSAPQFHTQRPDADNLAKAIKDALKGHMWADDSQIVRLSVTKLWVQKVYEQGVRVAVQLVGDP